MPKDVQSSLDELLKQVRACRICEAHLPLGPRPVLRARASARLLLASQAPGIRVHRTGIPWNDPSGDELRAWLGLSKEEFYDESKIAIIPMGLCYPGSGTRGDLPPRKECAEHWHARLLEHLPNLCLTILIGMYAQRYYLGKRRKATLTETVRAYREYLPEYWPVPHPSGRNQYWHQANPWFRQDILPTLRETVRTILDQPA